MPFFLWFVKVFLSSVPAQASYPLPKLFLFPLLSAMLSLIFLALKVHRTHKKRKLQLWWNNRGLSKIYPWLFGSSLQSYRQTIPGSLIAGILERKKKKPLQKSSKALEKALVVICLLSSLRRSNLPHSGGTPMIKQDIFTFSSCLQENWTKKQNKTKLLFT